MDKIIEILKEKGLTIDGSLFYNYKKLNLTEKELVFLIYLLNHSTLFNPKEIEKKLGWTMAEILDVVDKLSSKGFLKIEVLKQENVCEEHIMLNGLYEKLAFIYLGKEEKKEVKITIFDTFEKEFGRPLSPIEYEIIKGWMEDNFSEDIILLALKEAVYNGVFRLNYIDKILFEWRKKGIQTKQDVERNNKKFNERKANQEQIFDYDWLNE